MRIVLDDLDMAEECGMRFWFKMVWKFWSLMRTCGVRNGG